MCELLKKKRGLKLFVLALAVAMINAYCYAGITITKAVMEDKTSSTEVTSGYADADISVSFKGDATCNCGCPNLSYKWYFGDGTSASSKDATHTYGTSGAGNRSPYLNVKCSGCSDEKNSGTLSVSAIDGIQVDRIGDITSPTTNGRLSFNSELRVAGTALPSGVSGSDKIDWHTSVVATDIDKANTSSGSLPNLADADWPSANTSWGSGTLYISIDGPYVSGQQGELNLTGTSSFVYNDKSIKRFYDGTSKNKDASVPNWFYYYKDNAGGGAYHYTTAGSSYSTSGGGISSIYLADNTYTGNWYWTHDYTNPGSTLKMTGTSGTNMYYAHFIGVLAHETQHATNEQNPPGGGTDRDSDYLTNTFETGTSKTGPDDDDSAEGSTNYGYTDDEYYANGPVEKSGIDGADTSNDWAKPGTKW